jgi:DNA invertase Pin-like site-specific DNA recombinase
MATTRAALYARVSTSNHGQNVGLQLDELRQVARQRGWSVVGEYVDEGISGTKTSRPALDRVMASARRGEFDVLTVWRFDRFARSTTHLLTALEEFRTIGVEFLSLREQIDTSTPMGKAMFTIVAAVAALERDIIAERVRAGVARAKANGVHCGRPLRNLDPRAAQLLIDQGHPLRDVARMLAVPGSTLRRRLAEFHTVVPG